MRLRLGLADLARTTFAVGTPYCELPISIQVLQQPASQFRWLWRRRRTPIPIQARRLQELIPAHGSVPTFLAPEGSSCLDEALDTVLSTPATKIRAELAEMRWTTAPSAWLSDLACGRRQALEELAVALRVYHDQVLAPLWPSIQKVVSAELTARARQLAIDGSEATLNSLHPQIRWRDGGLDVDAPGQLDFDLEGRGLRLMPSIWTRSAVPVSWRQPTLVYPIHPASWAQLPADNHHNGLATVFGTTRARVLQALTTEHSTTELARAVGISVASASTHATALRGAGMVMTRRDGHAVRHVLTELGRAVASANASGIEPADDSEPIERASTAR
ncbi:MAG TPA: winged helix-turn-helix domain-containing protein [Jiangellaceae bacterium]|nr:winged helix-turn-helix domain-containing protein [Jiangellaceae bacterium]